MIISHKNKFIYIKTRKTASTSIQILFARFCGDQDILTPIIHPTTKKGIIYNKMARNYKILISNLKLIKYSFYYSIRKGRGLSFIKDFLKTIFKNPKKNIYRLFFQGFHTHDSAEKIKTKVGSIIWNDYFKFTFERNPWDKLVSYYYHVYSNSDPSFKNFDTWIKSLKMNQYRQPYNFLLYTFKNRVILDFIGKYENLHKDLNFILNKLNLPMKELPKEKTNYRKEKKYKKYYSDELRDLVNKKYAKEINLFNFKF